MRKEIGVMKLFKTIVVLGAMLLMASAFAQSALADDMQILRDKIKADKKFVAATELQLTESEAKSFWPIYEAYQKELDEINKRTMTMINSYADAWNAKSMNDEKAKKLSADFLAIRADELKLLTSYLPRLENTLPATKVARYLQFENKIRAIVNYDLAVVIPLIP
jgi:hypothetical protein